MRLTISRDTLLEGLLSVGAVVPAKTTLPVLSNVLLEGSDRGVRIAGTDLDIAVSTELAADVDSTGGVTLPARRLTELVRELPSVAVRVTTSGEQKVLLECGRAKFRLLGLPRDEFPTFPVVDFSQSWHLPSHDLQRLISRTAFAASMEESRPILNGVLWEVRDGVMRMVATNGHRLAKMEVPMGSSSGVSSAELIVPPKALDHVRRLFPAEEELAVARGESHLGFRSPFTSVFTRLIEGPYPNYEQVIPRDNDRVALSDRNALLQTLKRMSVLASDQTHRIRLSFNTGLVRFSVQTPDVGEAQDELPISYEGDPLEVGFNGSYLMEILRYIPTDEVRLTFKAPERAAVVEPVGWDDAGKYMCLIMPLRLVD